MKYNWQQKDWPHFQYELTDLEALLFEFTENAGRASGVLKALPPERQTEALLELMIAEAVKTSAIEGEYLSRQDVMSSIRNKLGLGNPEPVMARKAEGAGELMVAVRNTFADPLSAETLFAWHKMLMQGSSGMVAGAWRTHEEPMQVISGAMGKEKIHFEAPPSAQIAAEMEQFITWFNETAPGHPKEITTPMLRSAIAHLWFESIHPFEDGNGRIGRALSEKALSQNAQRPVLLSLSKAIEADKKAYYQALQQAQTTNEVSGWIRYFVKTVIEAQKQAEELIGFTLKKAKFFDRFKGQWNSRQMKVVHRMLEEGPEGFEGGMSAGKYVSITKTSKATATRDLQDLASRQALMPFGGGRSTRYQLNLEGK